MNAKPKPKPRAKAAPKIREIVSFDYAMKNILRDKANSGILAGFLTELLGRKVSVIAILESEGNVDQRGDKINRVDIKAQIDGGEIAIFEIQYVDLYDFVGKMLFNVSKAIVEQINSGDRYDVKKVYMIGIADFDMGAKREYLFSAKMAGFKGVHYNETIPFSQTRGFKPRSKSPKIDIHPEYFLILPQKFDNEIRSRFDEWVYALKNHAVKSNFTAAGIKEAARKMERLRMTEQERKAYDWFMEHRSDMDTAILTAEMKGEYRGLEKGLEEGIKKGRAEGEIQKALEIAKSMKAEGINIDKIAKITGLTKEQIGEIK